MCTHAVEIDFSFLHSVICTDFPNRYWVHKSTQIPQQKKRGPFYIQKMSMNNAKASDLSVEIFKDQAVLKLCDSCWAYI